MKVIIRVNLIIMEELFEDRAKALAEILKYDIEQYHDVNWTTIVEAAKLAGVTIYQGENDNE
jgi:hypothetical protein